MVDRRVGIQLCEVEKKESPGSKPGGYHARKEEAIELLTLSLHPNSSLEKPPPSKAVNLTIERQ
jgi:hypothetical protein